MVSQPRFQYTSTAAMSACGVYRYDLRREWDKRAPFLYVGGLNPSTANATEDDHTVRKLLGFAERLNCGGLVLWNLYAYRSTDPARLWALEHRHAVGPSCDVRLDAIFAEVKHDPGAILVAAWGAHAPQPRVDAVLELMADHRILSRLKSWGRTSSGAPRHPSRIGYSTPLEAWPA